MKKSFKITALFAACALCGTMLFTACDSQKDMTDDDLADLKLAVAATYAYSGAYSFDSRYSMVIATEDDGEATRIESGSSEKLTYDGDSGKMGYYGEQNYAITDSGYSLSSASKEGDYIIPADGVYNEYVYSDSNGRATSVKYEYSTMSSMELASIGEVGGEYSSLKQLSYVLDDFAGLDFSDISQATSVDEIKNDILDSLQSDLLSSVSMQDVTADCLTGKEDGNKFYSVEVSGTVVSGGETMKISAVQKFYINKSYITAVMLNLDMSYAEEAQSSAQSGTAITVEGVYNIGYSYDGSIIPSDEELALYYSW